MTILWSFSYNSFVKFHGKKKLGATWPYYTQIHVTMSHIIKGLHSSEDLNEMPEKAAFHLTVPTLYHFRRKN